MIGCFGVAPDLGQAISTATSGRYGGNMDYRGFKPGVEVMFPVSVPGALFFLGDVHAQQCDGEIVGTGIETAAEVTFTVRVLKGQKIGWPRGMNADEIFTIGNARPLDQALQHATTEMLDWLMADYGLDEVAASHVMGQAVRYDVANVFNPAYSVACRMAREHCPSALTSAARDQRLQRLQRVGLRRRLVPADAGDAGEAHGDAGLVAGRRLDGVEGDFEHELRRDGAHRAEALHRVLADEAVELHELLIGEAGIGLADRHEHGLRRPSPSTRRRCSPNRRTSACREPFWA